MSYTPITKPVTRVSIGALNGRYGPHSGRKLVATLNAGDVLTLRPARTRSSVSITLFDVYEIAMKCRANAVLRLARKHQKEIGGRLSSARQWAEDQLA